MCIRDRHKTERPFHCNEGGDVHALLTHGMLEKCQRMGVSDRINPPNENGPLWNSITGRFNPVLNLLKYPLFYFRICTGLLIIVLPLLIRTMY